MCLIYNCLIESRFGLPTVFRNNYLSLLCTLYGLNGLAEGLTDFESFCYVFYFFFVYYRLFLNWI